ncbi:MAG: SsrA-binding protein SmpB [Candidatus Berkelbacteria bacterium]|nr:SsrA-binding protein SmpB [Candidatus Berkelbacteria bacterium]MCR4307321.1 SsrA-binding protein SmpB [Candidatus Berkelbacteria bacterium]
MKSIASNKKAYFDYSITDDVEAGLVLTGEEIKAIRDKRVNISGSYVKPFIADGANELWWVGSNFNIENGDQSRSKKLLLHKIEIERLTGKLSAKNLTIVPLELYLSRGRAKLKIGLASRKQVHDKRETLKKRDIEREVARRLNDRSKK